MFDLECGFTFEFREKIKLGHWNWVEQKKNDAQREKIAHLVAN